MNKPAFDPNQPFQSVDEKPPFNPNAPFEPTEQPAPVQSESVPSERSGLDVVKEQATKFLPLGSQLGMKAMNLFQRGADKAGEIAAEGLASGVTPKVNPALPFPLNVSGSETPGQGLRASPEVAAGIGTAIQMAPDIISAVAPMTMAPATGKVTQEVAEQAPNFLQRLGARSLNKSAGIQPRTLMKMAGGENPANVGDELGQILYKEGATGLSPRTTFEKSSAVKEQFGKAVGDALDQIKQSGIKAETDASKALKPILDKWTELGDATLSENRVMARPYSQMFSKLEKLANQKGGTLSLDDVQSEMQEVGKLFNRIQETSDKYPALAELYGTLADVRDGIVQDIAERAGNPELTTKLLEANKGFSRYSRILPDIAKEAAKEGAGRTAFSLTSPIKSSVDAMRPLFSKAALSIGDLLSTNPASLGKYTPALMSEAAKGGENLNSFHMSLLEKDPAYLSLFRAAQGAVTPKSMFKKVAKGQSKEINADGKNYVFTPGKNGSLTAPDNRQARAPLFQNKKRAKVVPIASARA